MGKLWIATLGCVAAAAGAALAPGACATLNDLPQNTCGNSIVELTDDEDCDTLPVGADGGVTGVDAGFACSSTCRVLCGAAPVCQDGGGYGDAGPRCPDGWGCGVDGICRRPSGSFTAAAVELPELVSHLSIGDLDGDGRQDVVVDTGSALAVHYFTTGAALDQTVSIPAAQPTPALGDFNGDCITDVTYVLPSAVTVRLGSSDRSLPSIPFPLPLPTSPNLTLGTDELLLAINTVPITEDKSADSFKLKELLRVTPTTITTFLGSDFDPTAFVTLAAVGWNDLPAQTTEIPVGFFDEKAPCAQFVVADKSMNRIEVYSPCAVGLLGVVKWNDVVTSPGPRAVNLPQSLTMDADSVVYATDVNGDGHLDLVLYAQGVIAVAYGDGAGAFSSSPGPLALPDEKVAPYLCLGDVLVTPPLPASAAGCATLPPYAVADFNHDGVLDLVNACGIFLGGTPGGPKGCGVYGGLDLVATSGTDLAAAQWTVARLVDLNRDGWVDVVAGSCQDTSLTYLENAGGSGTFNTYPIPTTGGVDRIEVGDFDGDLVDDVAFTQRISPLVCSMTSAPDTPTSQSIGIVFGALSGGPSAPVELAIPPTPLTGVKQLVSAYLTAPNGVFQLSSNLLAVTTDPGDDSQYLVDLFQGSTDREIVAPYYLVDEDVGDTPWLVAMGRVEPGGGTGLAVLASEKAASAHQTEVWTVPSPSGVPLPLKGVDPTQYINTPMTGAWFSTLNLGGSYGDAMIGVLEKGGSSLYVFQPDANGYPSTAPAPTALASGVQGPIVVSDVDGDGADDVILFAPGGGVTVFWNGGQASGLTSTTTIQGALSTACSGAPGSVNGVVALRAAPSIPRALIIVSDNHTYLASPDPASPRTFPTVTCLDATLPLAGVGAVHLAAGDVDGDGVDDIVVGRPGSVQVYRGVPVVQ